MRNPTNDHLNIIVPTDFHTEKHLDYSIIVAEIYDQVVYRVSSPYCRHKVAIFIRKLCMVPFFKDV